MPWSCCFVLYPSVHHFADRGLRRLIEEEYARQVKDQREELKAKLTTVLQQIDALEMPNLAAAPRVPLVATSNAAFELWGRTNLATERLASSLELYTPEGRLARRFANLPDYVSTTQEWKEPSCDWETFEEASRFGSEERRLFHAGRGICEPGTDVPTGGSVVVNVMLDYETLPFITARNPYNELFVRQTAPPEGSAGRSVQFVVRMGPRLALRPSARAFPLDDTLLDLIAQSRRPFWTTMNDGEREYSTYIQNDLSPLRHRLPCVTRLITYHLAELATLVGLTYVGLLARVVGVGARGTTAASGRALLREVRASFYRKLFLAFIASAVLPVMCLDATRTFFELQLNRACSPTRCASPPWRNVSSRKRALQTQMRQASDDIMVWLRGRRSRTQSIAARRSRHERARPLHPRTAARADAGHVLSRHRKERLRAVGQE